MNSHIFSILKSGWGLFLALACIVSVILDFVVRDHLPLTSKNSFILGWLFVVGLFVVPAACARQIGLAPMNGFLAVLWCIIAVLAWSIIHVGSVESGSQHTLRPNLALLGGLALCWRLLVAPKIESISPEPEQNTPPSQQAPEGEGRVSITEHRIETATNEFDGMSRFKKRILVGGILAICVSAAIYALGEDETPSVAWMFVISAIWASLAYLLPDSVFIGMKALFAWRLWLKLAAIGIGILAVIFSGAVITKTFKRDAAIPKASERAPQILESEALALVENIDSLAPEQQAQAADILRRYRQQQIDLGEPEWPSYEQAEQESESRFRSLFDDLSNVDKNDPSFSQVLRLSQDHNATRAKVAGIAFLARFYNKTPDEVGWKYDFYRDDCLSKRGQKTGLDDRAFYSFAQGEVKRLTARESAAIEGKKAALRGEDSGKALAAWQAANPDTAKEDSGIFATGYKKAMEEDGDSLPVAANLLSLLERQNFKVGQPFTDEQATQLGGMVEQLAGMKPRQRKSIYRAMNARIEAAGYDQKGFWAQMLSELDRGRAGPVNKAGKHHVQQQDEQVGNVKAELEDIMAGRLDLVKPPISWLYDVVKTGLGATYENPATQPRAP